MVYLVDDDQDDLELVQEALKEHSYKGPVHLLRNGKMLIDELQGSDSKPGVIILDLNMPLLDGFETLEAIRKNPRYSQLPVIILTASSKLEDEARCFELGCDYYMNKPNNIDDYEQLIVIVKKFIAEQGRS